MLFKIKIKFIKASTLKLFFGHIKTKRNHLIKFLCKRRVEIIDFDTSSLHMAFVHMSIEMVSHWLKYCH